MSEFNQSRKIVLTFQSAFPLSFQEKGWGEVQADRSDVKVLAIKGNNIVKKIFLLSFIVSILLSACGSSTPTTPSQPAPTVTQAPTIAVTATPINTSTPEPTATKEIKQYPICVAENYSECVIPYQDLFNGKYYNWLNALPVDPFNASKVEQLKCYGNSTEITFVGKPSANSFSSPETSMIRRGITVGITSIKDGEVGYQFYGERKYLILPTFAYSDSEKKGVWLILLFPAGGWSDDQLKEHIETWNNSGTLMVIMNTYFSAQKAANSSEDPLVVNTFKLFPDMQQRLDNFGVNCDPGYISEPGIVLETSYTR